MEVPLWRSTCSQNQPLPFPPIPCIRSTEYTLSLSRPSSTNLLWPYCSVVRVRSTEYTVEGGRCNHHSFLPCRLTVPGGEWPALSTCAVLDRKLPVTSAKVQNQAVMLLTPYHFGHFIHHMFWIGLPSQVPSLFAALPAPLRRSVPLISSSAPPNNWSHYSLVFFAPPFISPNGSYSTNNSSVNAITLPLSGVHRQAKS